MNIRGLGAVIKKKKISSLIAEEKLDFIAIQETKMEVMDDNLCKQLWGGTGCSWSMSMVIGNSDGMLSIWNSSKGQSSSHSQAVAS